MQLIPDFSKKWHKLWSVRLSLINTAVVALSAYWFAAQAIVPPVWFIAVGVLLQLAPAVGRVLYQKELHTNGNGDD